MQENEDPQLVAHVTASKLTAAELYGKLLGGYRSRANAEDYLALLSEVYWRLCALEAIEDFVTPGSYNSQFGKSSAQQLLELLGQITSASASTVDAECSGVGA
jgi:hypothetical protein